MANVQRLQAQQIQSGSQIPRYLVAMLEKYPNMQKEQYLHQARNMTSYLRQRTLIKVEPRAGTVAGPKYCDPPPNLWAFTGVTYLIPPNYLSMIRRFTGAPYQK
jgi:hypothetical protein